MRNNSIRSVLDFTKASINDATFHFKTNSPSNFNSCFDYDATMEENFQQELDQMLLGVTH